MKRCLVEAGPYIRSIISGLMLQLVYISYQHQEQQHYQPASDRYHPLKLSPRPPEHSPDLCVNRKQHLNLQSR